MRINELKVHGAFEVIPQVQKDDRGEFLEWYRFDKLAEITGRNLQLRQANSSVSKYGALRGIHFSELEPGQAKYVTCTSGAVLDFVVDIRVGSPTFGKWDSVLLDDKTHNSVFISEGLGHAFLSLSEGAFVTYLVSDVYKAQCEHGINPLDPEIGLDFELNIPLLLSNKDRDAPGLLESLELGLLPDYEYCKTIYSQRSQERVI